MGVHGVPRSGRSMSTADAFKGLQAALLPLGIELGRDTLHLWRDRENAGHEPLPEAALKDLMAWCEKQLADRA